MKYAIIMITIFAGCNYFENNVESPAPVAPNEFSDCPYLYIYSYSEKTHVKITDKHDIYRLCRHHDDLFMACWTRASDAADKFKQTSKLIAEVFLPWEKSSDGLMILHIYEDGHISRMFAMHRGMRVRYDRYYVEDVLELCKKYKLSIKPVSYRTGMKDADSLRLYRKLRNELKHLGTLGR